MIDQKEQEQIKATIRAISTRDGELDEERAHLLFVGVHIALPTTLPPDWQMNIQCGRVDRILNQKPSQATEQ